MGQYLWCWRSAYDNEGDGGAVFTVAGEIMVMRRRSVMME